VHLEQVVADRLRSVTSTIAPCTDGSRRDKRRASFQAFYGAVRFRRSPAGAGP
jgi:hypothetical protein